MEQIGAVTLGKKTNKKFLTGLIPKEWEEIVYEHETYWSCRCSRNDAVTAGNFVEKEGQFDKICENIISEFGKHLMEIYSISSAGVHFVVYLRKLTKEEK